MLLFHLFSNNFLSLGAQRSAEEKLHSRYICIATSILSLDSLFIFEAVQLLPVTN